MKTLFTLFVLTLFFLSMEGIQAQNGLLGGSAFPLKSQSSLFGKDIVINDSSTQDQHNVVICSAFNGWLYCVYSHQVNNLPYLTALISKDAGLTWEIIAYGPAYFLPSKVTNISIIACGSSISELRIFIGWTYYNSSAGWGGATVSRFQAEPFQVEATPIVESSYSRMYVSLCSDFPNPSPSSNPYSVAVLYCQPCFYDSLICIISIDGGINFSNHHIVAFPYCDIRKVNLSYGYSPSWNTGRFYAVWDEFPDTSAVQGHIYTARSISNVNSGFTIPLCIDSLDPSMINKCRNPVIATQFDNLNNDSVNLTSVILCEKYSSLTNSYDISGTYNKKAANTNDYIPFNLANTSNNEMQPGIAFNPGDTSFIVTYYNEEPHQLPFLKNSQNLTNPNSWDVITPQYNDSPDIDDPEPMIAVNDSLNSGIFVWIKSSGSDNGVALFDAEYSTYTSIPTLSDKGLFDFLRIFPNPCKSKLYIKFINDQPESLSIFIYSSIGEQLKKVDIQKSDQGSQLQSIDISDLPDGCYYCSLRTNRLTKTDKFIIQK